MIGSSADRSPMSIPRADTQRKTWPMQWPEIDHGHPSPGLPGANCSDVDSPTHRMKEVCLLRFYSMQWDCIASLFKNHLPNYLNCLYEVILSDSPGYFHPVCNNLLVPFSYVAAGSAQPLPVLMRYLLLSLSKVPKPDWSERCIWSRTEIQRSLTQRIEEESKWEGGVKYWEPKAWI